MSNSIQRAHDLDVVYQQVFSETPEEIQFQAILKRYYSAIYHLLVYRIQHKSGTLPSYSIIENQLKYIRLLCFRLNELNQDRYTREIHDDMCKLISAKF